MQIIDCTADYASQILAILNDAILHSTALYDYQPRTMENMTAWFESKQRGNYPVIGIINDNNQLMAFGSYGPFRAWPAYKYTIEHSLYVQKDHRGKGLGKQILAELIKHAERQEYHCMMAGIDSNNAISLQLHQAFGFVLCGTIRQVGFKFNQWLDLAFYQLLLKTPANPVDG